MHHFQLSFDDGGMLDGDCNFSVTKRGDVCTPVIRWCLKFFDNHSTHWYHWMVIKKIWSQFDTLTPLNGNWNFSVVLKGKHGLNFFCFSKMIIEAWTLFGDQKIRFPWNTPHHWMVTKFFWSPRKARGVGGVLYFL